MPEVAVVVDTTAYMPREVLERSAIHEVSLYVNDGERHEREADITDYSDFYERLRGASSLPTTSQPSIGDFLEVYEPLADEGRDIVSVHIAGGISGTVESARQAAADLAGRRPGRRVEVIDSPMSCGGLAAVALAASAAARRGADVDAVASHAREAVAATRIWFAVDTLEYLRRGGRIGRAQAWLGGALKIKPILTLDDEITPIERVRTSARAFDRLVDYMRARRADGADGWIVQHIQAPDAAQRLVDAGREVFGSEPVFVSEIGPVIGAHIGPGLLGVGGAPRELMGL
jgi:DegV family protein with EDD domain